VNNIQNLYVYILNIMHLCQCFIYLSSWEIVSMIIQIISFISITIVNNFGDTYESIYKNRKQIIRDTYVEHVHLGNISKTVITMCTVFDDKISTVSCLSTDDYLFVLSVSVTRMRYCINVTFIIRFVR